MLEIAPRVRDDMGEIAEWVGQDSPARAVTLIENVLRMIDRVALTPRQFRLRPEIGEAARLAMVGQYAVLFRETAMGVRVERVMHASRDLSAAWKAYVS